MKKKYLQFSTKHLITFLIFIFYVSVLAQHLPDQNMKTRKIIIASEVDYPPFCIVNKKGEADGFSVDLIKEVAKVMRLDIQIKTGTWANIKNELIEGKIDALPLVGRSPERAKIFDFTFPYHSMHGGIFVRKGTKDIKKVSDLKEKQLAVMEGDNAHEYIIRKQVTNNIVTTKTFSEAFLQLSKGNCDAVIAQKLLGLNLISNLNLNNIECLNIQLKGFNQDFSFAVKKGDSQLLAILNEGLAIIIANGTYDKIHSKWWTPIQIQRLSFKDKLNMLLPYVIVISFIIALIVITLLKTEVARKTKDLKTKIIKLQEIEISLRENKDKLRLVIETIPDLVWLKNIHGIYLLCNKKFERFFGNKESDIIGKTDYDFMDKQQADFFREKDDLAMKAGKATINEEEVIYANDGHKEFLETIKTPMRNLDGDIIGVLGIARDISERKKTEERLSRFAKIFEESINEIYMFDSDTYKFIQVNNAALKNLGYTNIEIKNLTPLDIKPEYSLERFEKHIKPLKNEEEEQIVFETFHKRKDNSLYNVEVHLQLLKHNNKHIFSAIIIDTTEKKDMETQKIKLEEQLRHTQKMEAIGTLAGGIAHDFNNILGAISGFNELCMMEVKNDTHLKDNFNEIQKAVDKAAHLTKQLLGFSRKQVVLITNFDLNTQILDMWNLLKRVCGEDIALINNFKDNHLYIDADIGQIQQVLMNIVINAAFELRNLEKGKKKIISISTNYKKIVEKCDFCNNFLKNGEYVIIEISDTGHGIQEEILDKIFDPFFTTKKLGSGTGLGLSTVYGIVKQNNGHICVCNGNHEGLGAIFKIYWPLSENKKHINLKNNNSNQFSFEEKNKTILIIEDELQLLNINTKVLTKAGYNVLSARSGEIGIEIMNQENNIDLLFTDVILPGIDGIDCAKEFNKLFPNGLILYCSGYSNERLNIDGLRNSEIHLIKKPFNIETLVEKIEYILSQGK